MIIGRHTYGKPHVHGNKRMVEIGSFCSIAKGVIFISQGDHHHEWISTFPFRERLGFGNKHRTGKGKIHIGSDVWLGTRCVILSGVRIGHGAVIGASAVISKDVRPYAIMVGNPAMEIKRRFSDEEVKLLLDLRWWDWSDEKILMNADMLTSPIFQKEVV